jgi:AcrR family transcriptional regulator
MSSSEPDSSQVRAAYRRATGSARGEARRRELLDRVTDDLAARGLVGFSLRRAARAAGTTHKVLLYYFDSADDLMTKALAELRNRRITTALTAATTSGPDRRLSARVRLAWEILADREGSLQALDQATGLAMYDPDRYADLGRDATEQYLPSLKAICPADWSPERKEEIAVLVLACLRGLLADWLTSRDDLRVGAGLAALCRALDEEERSGQPANRLDKM